MMETKYLDGFLDGIVKDKLIPGADLLVAVDGKLVYRRTVGYADIESGKPLDRDTAYYIYSCSKVLTVSAAMQLFERGAFLMTEPVATYLPAFEGIKVKEGDNFVPAHRAPVMRDLFCMCAGLNYDLEAPAILDAIKATDGRAPTLAVADAIAAGGLDFHPGEHFGYSLCHDILAAVVEKISGRRFSEYVRENILEPLGMTHTFYHDNEETKAHMATLYQRNDKTGALERTNQKNCYIFGPDYDSGGAGVITTAEDYLKFVMMLAAGGVAPDGKRILARPTVDLMRTNLLSGEPLREFQSWDSNAEYGYAYGVRTKMGVGRGGDLAPDGEFGWGGAAGALVAADPDRHIAIFYAQHMLNNQEPYIHPRLRNLIHAMLSTEI